MAFRRLPQYQERIVYAPNATRTFKFPAGNLIAGMHLDINLEVDIATGAASNAPDFQIERAIKEIEIVKNSNQSIWKLSGEALGLLFQKRQGIAAPGNATISGTVATNKQGRSALYLPFSPDDALVPWDYLMDTRGHKYEMRIVFRDLAAAGTLFGTLGSAVITANNEENYIDLTLDTLQLKAGPGGVDDALKDRAPLMRGLIENTVDITQTNATGADLDLPINKTLRNIYLWTVHETNANQQQGNNGVFTDMVKLVDSQNSTYQSYKARTLREMTAQRWEDSSLPAGLYHIPLTRWGAAVDTEVSDRTRELNIEAAVAKLTNATSVRVISDTIEQQ